MNFIFFRYKYKNSCDFVIIFLNLINILLFYYIVFNKYFLYIFF